MKAEKHLWKQVTAIVSSIVMLTMSFPVNAIVSSAEETTGSTSETAETAESETTVVTENPTEESQPEESTGAGETEDSSEAEEVPDGEVQVQFVGNCFVDINNNNEALSTVNAALGSTIQFRLNVSSEQDYLWNEVVANNVPLEIKEAADGTGYFYEYTVSENGGTIGVEKISDSGTIDFKDGYINLTYPGGITAYYVFSSDEIQNYAQVPDAGYLTEVGNQSVNAQEPGYYYFYYKNRNGYTMYMKTIDTKKDAPTIAVKGILTENVNGNATHKLFVTTTGAENGVIHLYADENKSQEIKSVPLTGNGSESEIEIDNLNSYICVESGGKMSELYAVNGAFHLTVSYSKNDKFVQQREVKVSVSSACDVVCISQGKDVRKQLEANGEATFEITEKATITANGISCSVDSGNIDTDVPVVELQPNNHQKWTNVQTISGTVKDQHPDQLRYVYKTIALEMEEKNALSGSEAGTSISCKDSKGNFEIPDVKSGFYYIWAVDEAGTPSDVLEYEAKIDTEAPEITKVEFTAEEKNDGSLSGVIKTIANTILFGGIYSDTIVVDIEAKDKPEDEANSDLSKQVELHFLNQKGEEISSYTADNISWIKDADSAVSAAKITVKINDLKNIKDEFEGTISVVVSDNAGNKTAPNSDSKNEILVDNTKPGKPNCKVTTKDGNGYSSPDATHQQWVNQPIFITISDPDNAPISKIKKYQYRIENADPSQKDTEWTDLTGKQIEVEQEFINATYYIRAVSGTGIEGEEAVVNVAIKKSLTKTADYSIKGQMRNGWYVDSFPSIAVTIPNYEKYEPWIKAQLWIQDRKTGEYLVKDQSTGKYKRISSNSNDAKYTEIRNSDTVRPFTEDGEYDVYVVTIDEAENSSAAKAVKKAIYIDTTAPEYQEFSLTTVGVNGKVDILAKDASTVTYRYIYQNAVHINAKFDCNVSGLDKIEYQIAKSYASTGTWKTFDMSKGFDIETNQKFILKVRVTDRAGNVTEINSDGVILDNQAPVGEQLAPEITIRPDAGNGNGFHNGDVNVAISVQDPPYDGAQYDAAKGIYSGLQQVVYRVIADGVVTQEETLYSAGANPTDKDLQSAWNGSIVVDSARNNTNDIFVEVVATDRAGNERVSRTAEGAIRIDTTAPAIHISYDNNSPDAANTKYFKETRTATIEITERNFNPDDVRLSITNSDGSIPAISGWSEYGGTGNRDDTVHTATLTYSADGDYTFDIAFTDMADNVCTDISYISGTAAPQEFTIDRTAPVITVSYDNNAAVNGKYFSKPRVATVVIQEHNFDSSRVKITATASHSGKSIAVPSSNISWAGSGDSHTATISYKGDGDYTFDIQFTDMAGNESGAANYGSSVAGKDFVVDTTIQKPSVLINGKDGNGKAFQKDAVLSIQFGDINYDSYSLKLLRTVKGLKNVDVTKEFIPDLTVKGTSAEGNFDTFKKVKENDGIYTLTITLKDKAGNTETTAITFTINRFGSVYEYSDYLTDLIADGGAYVKAVDDDLVITEYNADKLVENSLNIVITKDGKPLDQSEYTVTPTMNNKVSTGESGWYQYDYTISKDNFTSDGVYKMVVSSKDEAGNTPENTNQEDQAILFRVDSTAPELTSITGLDKAVIKAQDVLVGYDAYDAIGLKSIKILVNDKEIGTITDFSADANNYNGTFDLTESKNVQKVQLIVEDMAGNITDTSASDFSSAYAFESAVTVSTNAFVLWYANRALFWGSIAGACLIVAGIGFLVFVAKKKKKSA